MNCEEIRDLMQAYTLGTASADEFRAVEEHLSDCNLHHDLTAMRASTMLIAAGVGSVDPPAGLKEKIMARVSEPAAVRYRENSPARRPWHRRLILANPIAAVLVVALGVMVVWNVMLQGADPTETFVHYYWGNDNDWLRIETVLGDPGAEVSLGGFDRLDESQLYHLWTTRGEQVLLVGVFNVNPKGNWAGEFDFTFEAGDRDWMTPEPASGSDQPTGDAVFKTRF